MGEIRDPIYGFITPSENELKIINTSLFQRLRKIRQLAMAFLVYPGANHTRFDHSLGVYHIASLMADKLLSGKDNEDKRRTIRLAALLHDIGHGPFSHVSEDVLNKYSDINSSEDAHEKISMRLINNSEELELGAEKQTIVGLLSGKKVDLSLMKEIISGPLDADKIDYLLRDSHFCGVKYGVFDLERMLNTLRYYEEPGDKHMAVNHDGVNSLEQFVLAKYYMTTQVYRHKVRSVSDAMIIRGLELGIEKDGIEFLNKLYRYEDTEEYLTNYLNYWDDRVVNELVLQDKKGYATEIFTRLYQRRLFKRVFSEKLKDLEIDRKLRDKIIEINAKENEDQKKDLEQQIAKLPALNCPKEYVIINCFTIKSVKEMSRDSEGKIIIIDEEGEKQSFEEASTIFSSIDEKMKDTYLEIYAPFEYNDLRDKTKKLGELKEQTRNILAAKGD